MKKESVFSVTASASAPFRARHLPACLIALALLLLGAALPAAAQQAAAPADIPAASTEELQALVETLETPSEREAFVQRLKTLIEARAGAPATAAPADTGLWARLAEAFAERLATVQTQLAGSVAAVAAVPAGLGEAAEALADPERRRGWLIVGGQLLLVLGAGLLADWLVRRLLARARERMGGRTRPGLLARSLLLIARAALDLAPVLALAAGAYALIPLLGLHPTTTEVAILLVNASIVSRLVVLAGRALLAPNTPTLRLIPMADDRAAYFFAWLRRVAVVVICGYAAAESLRILGVQAGAAAMLLKLVGLITAGMVITFLIENREDVARVLRGQGEMQTHFGVLRRRLAELWHLLAILYVLAVYAVWAIEISGGFVYLARATLLTVAILLAARGLQQLLEQVYKRGLRLSPKVHRTYPELEERCNSYIPIMRRITTAIIDVASVILIAQAWGTGILGWFTQGLGRELLGTLFSVVLVLALVMAAWELLSSILERVQRRAAGRSGKRSARVQTLLPLLRNALRILFVALTALIVLSEIGVDIGPLLAGAGVIGLAIGFGSQTLVKDVITGVFILAEDSLAVGDWVEAGGHSGEVESITVRTLTLRDLQGQVHVVPFSEVTSILNMTRDFGYALIDVEIAYRENTDKVIAMLHEVAQAMKQDPTWMLSVAGDLEIFGVNALGESSVTVRVRLKTTAGMHWSVRREFLRRTKLLFDEKGVEIPYPHRTLYFGVGKDGTAPPARVDLRGGRESEAPAGPRQAPVTEALPEAE